MLGREWIRAGEVQRGLEALAAPALFRQVQPQAGGLHPEPVGLGDLINNYWLSALIVAVLLLGAAAILATHSLSAAAGCDRAVDRLDELTALLLQRRA